MFNIIAEKFVILNGFLFACDRENTTRKQFVDRCYFSKITAPSFYIKSRIEAHCRAAGLRCYARRLRENWDYQMTTQKLERKNIQYVTPLHHNFWRS